MRVRVTRCWSLLGSMLDFAVLYSLKCQSLLPASRQLPGTAAEGPSLRGIMISAKQAYKAAPALISREVGDAFAVVEPHVPRPVGCEDLPGLGDESWLRREHGDERSPRFSLLEVLLAHQSFVGQSAAD
jgi:hypothetical protein